jgi:hypothetical protein
MLKIYMKVHVYFWVVLGEKDITNKRNIGEGSARSVLHTFSLSHTAFEEHKLHILGRLSKFHIRQSTMASRTQAQLRKRKELKYILLRLDCLNLSFILFF